MEEKRVNASLSLRELIYGLDFPKSHVLLKGALEEMWAVAKAERRISVNDKELLNSFTRMFFRSGEGTYIGIESRLPSVFIDIYPLWLQFHAEYLQKHDHVGDSRGKRILVVKNAEQLKNDRMNNRANYEKFLNWHRDNSVELFYIEEEKAKKIAEEFDLHSTDVAFWENSYAVIFNHSDPSGVELKVVGKDETDSFQNIKRYVERIERESEQTSPAELITVPAPLAVNWKGYTGSSAERRTVYAFLSRLVKRYRNHNGDILDAAAGIGNEAIYLLHNDFDVLINEYESNFSEILKKNIADDAILKEKRVTLEQMRHRIFDRDWRELEKDISPESLKAILVLGNSLCMVSENGEQERTKCIGQFYDSLCLGGILVVDERNCDKILKVYEKTGRASGRCVMYPGKEVDCQITPLHDHAQLLFEFTKSGKPVGELAVAYLQRGELLRMLSDVGFRKVRIYSDLKLKKPVDDNADFFTYVATKEGIKKSVHKRRQAYAGTKIKRVSRGTIVIGAEDEATMLQWGVIGKSGNRLVKFDLNAPHVVCVCGRQGSGKGYTIGVLCEMLLSDSIEDLSKVEKKATVIVLHNPVGGKKSEFWSMTKPNDDPREKDRLKREYGIEPKGLVASKDIKVFIDPSVPTGKESEFEKDYDTKNICRLKIDPSTLGGKEWEIFLSTGGTKDQDYITALSRIAVQTGSLDINAIRAHVASELDGQQQKLAVKRLEMLKPYIAASEAEDFVSKLAVGGLNIFDFRKTKCVPEDIFSVMTLILTVLQTRKNLEEEPFVFVINEAHTYFKNGISKSFVESLDNLIRLYRHGLNWLFLDTQRLEDLDEGFLQHSDVKIVHALDLIGGANARARQICGSLTDTLPDLDPGWCVISARKCSEGKKPVTVRIRPRITLHGAPTKTAVTK